MMNLPLLFSCFVSFLLLYCNVSIALVCKSGSGNKITVDPSGGKFKTIQGAIDSVPSGNDKWIHFQIAAATYKEKVKIPISKQCIFLDGEDSKSTIIEWGDHGSTGQSITFSTLAPNTVARGIQFKNTYNRPPELLEDESDNLVPALSAAIDGDKCAFYDCAFVGIQDSLWDSKGRHYYKDCYLQGGVDFIFGTGQTVFEGSTITYAMGEYAANRKTGSIAAQGRDSPSDPGAFVFKNCKFTGSGGGKAYLGRAWKPYSRVIISDSDLSDVIDPVGWDAWNSKGQESKITFVENNNKGPGANTSKRVKWLKKIGSGSDLSKLLSPSYNDADGWIAKLPLNNE